MIDHRQLVRTLAYARVAVGGALTVLPGPVGGRWIGGTASDPGAKVMIRALGIRDLALGWGTLQALTNGDAARPWVTLSAASDAVDAAATLLAIRRIPAGRAALTVLVAAGAAAVGMAAADRLD